MGIPNNDEQPKGLCWRRVFDLLRPHPWLCVGHAGTIVIAALANIALAGVWKYMFDDAIPAGDRVFLVQLVGGALGLLVLMVLMFALRAWFVGTQTAVVLEELRREMKRCLLQQPFSYFAKVSVGDDVARFTSDVNAVETLFTISLPNLLMGATLGLVSLVSMFILDWRLALFTVCVVPLAVIGPKLLSRAVSRASVGRSSEEARVATTVKEALSTHPVIPLFGLTQHFIQRSDRELARLRVRSQRMIALSQLSGFSTILGAALGTVAVVSAGALLAIEGYTTTGALLGFFTLLLNLSGAANLVSVAIPEMAKAAGGLRRIDALLIASPVKQSELPGSLAKLSKALTFDEVTFTYPQATKPSIDRLSLTIHPGEAVAFVGPSGSGKSTVLKLLMQLYEPDSGSIHWDGELLGHSHQSALWDKLGVVLQDAVLFDDTLGANIGLGCLGASESAIRLAAEAAGLGDFISQLPAGLDTPVGEGGGRLSGGQRQRVAIARALIRNPDVLVLDEVTAALDQATEAEVNQTIERLRDPDRVLISVTHRLNAIRAYDRIFVLKDGQLCEEGDDRSLMAAGGLYAKLVSEGMDS